MAKNAQNIRNAKSANIEMWPILIPPDDHWPQNMWKTKENTMECLRKNRAEWKSTKKHPKNYFLKTFPKNILFFGQNYPKICTKKDFKKNWLVTYTLGWNCSGGSVSGNPTLPGTGQFYFHIIPIPVGCHLSREHPSRKPNSKRPTHSSLWELMVEVERYIEEKMGGTDDVG